MEGLGDHMQGRCEELFLVSVKQSPLTSLRVGLWLGRSFGKALKSFPFILSSTVGSIIEVSLVVRILLIISNGIKSTFPGSYMLSFFSGPLAGISCKTWLDLVPEKCPGVPKRVCLRLILPRCIWWCSILIKETQFGVVVKASESEALWVLVPT